MRFKNIIVVLCLLLITSFNGLSVLNATTQSDSLIKFEKYLGGNPWSIPLEGITVKVLGTDYQETSNKNGLINIHDVPAGSYFLHCMSPGLISLHVFVNLPCNDTFILLPWSYLDKYEPNTIDHTKSLIIGAICEPDGRTGIQGATVTITPNIGVICYSFNGFLVDFTKVSTSENGAFVIGNVPSGTYNITAQKAGKTFQTFTITVPSDPSLCENIAIKAN